jgi:hypothetical protein
MTYGREVSTVQGQGAMRIMPDLSNRPAAFGTDQQRRVWRLYDAGRLTANQATTKLLRLNLDQSPENFHGLRITSYVRRAFTI